MMRLRHYWLVAHHWMGLGFGCVLLLAAITGSLLVLARPLDEAMHPRLVGRKLPVRPPCSL